MASMRSIKRRIRSVGSTQQITRAMNLVAASKFQRAKAKLDSARPFYEETNCVIQSLVAASQDLSSPFIQTRPVENTAFVVISGDRGLCGGYNVNAAKAAGELVAAKGHEQIVTVGIKARDYFKRRKRRVIRTYQGVSETPFYEDAREIGLFVMDLYNARDVDEVYLVYTSFQSMLRHTVRTVKILPLDKEALVGDALSDGEALDGDIPRKLDFEPDAETLFEQIIPKYICTFIYGALVEASVCEQGARMTSMDNATKNSMELIDKFTLQYNRARQGAITQEITEIVGGANALGDE
ncbi:MAG: ATP synthase F1 subunit gamma [Clostridiales bacterium]|jgi:F-type H+-transporting ATPase subunit gamma|nr:ATP synthase F1 subunit gamma [Clostridiales bacterium]